jgi:hypothetical protein
VKLYHRADDANRSRILHDGFDELDGLAGNPGVVMFSAAMATGALEIDVPDDVAQQYGVYREKAQPGEPPAFYRLPVDVANRYLRGPAHEKGRGWGYRGQ